MTTTRSDITAVSALLLVATLTTAASTVPADLSPASCTGGFTAQRDICYQYISSTKTWNEAANHCRTLDAYLAEPRTQWQIDFLKDVSFKESTDIWLGATDQAVEGKWVWAQSGVVDGLTDWGQGQPDDYGSREDCLEISRHFNSSWNDLPCDQHIPFICQKEMTTKTNDTSFDDVTNCTVQGIVEILNKLKQLEQELKHNEDGLILCGSDVSWNGTGDVFNGSPENPDEYKTNGTRTKDVRVSFKKPYNFVPSVSVGLMQLDNNGMEGHNRIVGELLSVDTEGFTFRCETWGYARDKLYRLGFSWKSNPQ